MIINDKSYNCNNGGDNFCKKISCSSCPKKNNCLSYLIYLLEELLARDKNQGTNVEIYNQINILLLQINKLEQNLSEKINDNYNILQNDLNFIKEDIKVFKESPLCITEKDSRGQDAPEKQLENKNLQSLPIQSVLKEKKGLFGKTKWVEEDYSL